jgi:hypothetical protein
MRSVRSLVAAAALAVALAALIPAVSAAATPAAAAPPKEFTANLGDLVRVASTGIGCIATGTAQDRGVACSILQKTGVEAPGSLGVALSAKGEAIVLKFSASDVTEVARVPAVHHARAARAARAVVPAVHIAQPGQRWKIASTDILCEVKLAGYHPGVVCSRNDAKGPRANTNSVAMTTAAVALFRFNSKRQAVVKYQKLEPTA